jgi:hypothetical protein
MKTNTTQSNQANAWIFRFLLLIAILMGVCLQLKAQNETPIDKGDISPPGLVLVNYTFEKVHKWPGYPYYADEVASGIESWITSLEPFNETSSGAVRTGDLAFKENIGNNGALVMQPSCGDQSRYFELMVTGESLRDFGNFKMYMMAQGHPHAATTLTLYYSANNVDFFEGGSFNIPNHTHFFEHIYDISTADVLNTYNLETLYLRIYTSGTHDGKDCGAYRIEIDNVQIYGETDTEPPVIIACAPPLAVTASVDNCSFPMPDFTSSIEISDNAPLDEMIITQEPAAGTLMGIGVHNVILYVSDKQGNKANCATTFTVNGFIYAGDDVYYMAVNATGFAGNALENDYMHCLPVTADMVNISIVSVSFDADLSLNTTSGHVVVHSVIEPGTYIIVYRIHEKGGNPDVFADGTITIYVTDPLPIWDIRLNAVRNGNDITLRWTYDLEENVSHFVAERSDNGNVFTPIPFGENIAVSEKQHDQGYYQITDRDVMGRVWFYRVRLVYLDGRSKTSNIVQVSMQPEKDIRVYPNPVINQMVIQFPESGTYEIALISSTGQTQFVQKTIAISGEAQSIALPVSRYAPGTYVLRILNIKTGKVYAEKLMIQRN